MDRHELNKLVVGTILIALCVIGFFWWSDPTIAKSLKDGFFRTDLYYDNYNTPVPSTPLTNIKQVEVGGGLGGYSCVLTNSGGVKCWGANSFGQLGDGTTTNRLVPTDVIGLASSVQNIAVGVAHSCAVMIDGGMKCWGWNDSGQLGDGTTTERHQPTNVIQLNATMTSVAVSKMNFGLIAHTCAVTNSGGVKCWGANYFGQLGDGTHFEHPSPLPTDVIVLTSQASSISLGSLYSCALTVTGGIQCWGSAADPGLSTGVKSISSASSSHSDRGHDCVLLNTGVIRCWGTNNYGQLGDGTSVDRTSPTDVVGLNEAMTVVSAGDDHTCAVSSAGGVKCWGSNNNGELGDGSTTNRFVPTDVYGLSSGVKSVSSGTGHTCALMITGTVKCWGANASGQLGDGTTTSSLVPVDVIDPAASTPTSTSVAPTNTPIPPTNTPIPTPMGGCQTVGSVKVCANSFTNTGSGWIANGTVQIGDYVTVENSSVTANGNTLTGNGLVNMRTQANSNQLTALFRDSFDIATDSGVLTPKAVSGYEFKLNKLVGFSVQQNLYQLTLDVLNGKLSGSLNLDVVIPGQHVLKTISFTLDHNGAVSGSLADANFDLGRVMLNVKQATLSTTGFTIQAATLQLPPGLGGASASLSVNDARITGDGHFTLGSGSATIAFPNINVGGANGFSINGAQTTLTISNNVYLFSGRGTFVLPGIGPGGGGCKIGTSFTFASAPPPVREASLSIDGCFKIPIASTGFFLTGVSGAVQLDEGTVAIDLGISVEGGPDVPNLGVAISGSPGVHWDNSWALGLNGKLKIFKFDAADAMLKLSQARGLEGQIDISLVGGLVDGSSSLHVWKDSSSFHFTGNALVQVKIGKGKIYHGCAAFVCVDVPPDTVQGPMAQADFGEFRVGNHREYGIKGGINISSIHYAFFVDALGTLKFDGLDQYQLVGLRQLRAQNDQPANTTISDIRRFTVSANTPGLLIELAVNNNGPTLSLVTPNGQTLNAGSPGVITTTSLTQTLLAVANPLPGEWQIHVDNLTGSEQYNVVAFGARQAAVVAVPSVTDNGDGSYTIGVVATSNTPTSTISLFYDTSPISHTGQLLVQDLPLTTTTYRWQPASIPAGTYFIYALVDDPLGAPAFAYGASSITIHDSTPPAPPTDLRVSTLGSNAQISWQLSNTPDVAGYHVYYREPGGVTFVADIPNSQQSSYTQSGLYLNGGWEIAVSAYDLSGNESNRSAAVVATVYLNNIYLPVVLTNQ